MQVAITLVLAATLMTGLATAARADDAKGDKASDGPLTLTLVDKKGEYPVAGGQDPAALKKKLKEIQETPEGQRRDPLPAVPAVDWVLRITNTGAQDATVLLGGDPNVYTFEVKGPGVVKLPNLIAMTLEFRIPQAVTLGPGKSHEIPVRQLMDGMRGVSRAIFWTEPGEYTVTATYQLSGDQDGNKGALLKSKPVAVKVK